jgi:hypothetical protein
MQWVFLFWISPICFSCLNSNDRKFNLFNRIETISLGLFLRTKPFLLKIISILRAIGGNINLKRVTLQSNFNLFYYKKKLVLGSPHTQSLSSLGYKSFHSNSQSSPGKFSIECHTERVFQIPISIQVQSIRPTYIFQAVELLKFPIIWKNLDCDSW